MTTQPASHPYVLDFTDITLGDLARVGGKNASLGELFAALKPQGVGVLDGFATTADAYWRLLKSGDLEARLRTIFSTLDTEDLAQLSRAGQAAPAAVLDTPVPDEDQPDHRLGALRWTASRAVSPWSQFRCGNHFRGHRQSSINDSS
jgi:phosphoenolpyruvate synthase/pyruvate phosphate dikinase